MKRPSAEEIVNAATQSIGAYCSNPQRLFGFEDGVIWVLNSEYVKSLEAENDELRARVRELESCKHPEGNLITARFERDKRINIYRCATCGESFEMEAE